MKKGVKKKNDDAINPALKQDFRNLAILLEENSRKLSEIIILLKKWK